VLTGANPAHPGCVPGKFQQRLQARSVYKTSVCGSLYRGAQEFSQKVSDVKKNPGASLTTAKVMLMQVHRKLSTRLFGAFKVGLRRVFVRVQSSLSN